MNEFRQNSDLKGTHYMNCIKKIFQWLVSIGIGFFIVNTLCFCYERPTGWIDTPNGPSPAGWNPGTVLVHGTEGYGITKIDKNGYMNPDGVLQKNHILCMGSSHTQGKEVAPNEKYTALVNEYFSDGEGQLAAYNIACDGNYLPSLIKHFPAAVAAFPDAAVVTIEIFCTNFSAEQMEAAMLGTQYEERGSVVALDAQAGTKEILKTLVKESMPLLSLLKNKLEAMAKTESLGSTSFDTQQASLSLRKGIALLRSEFDGEILFVYHPSISIKADGSISCTYGETYETFVSACEENDIHVIDMGSLFLQNFEKTKTLPYGFANTTPATGHLNATGHRLIAEALIERLQEVI